MCFGFEYRNGVQIQRISSHCLEGSNSPFAEQNVKITLAYNIFGAHQQVLDRGCHASFEHYRKFSAADFSQECKVLHVPGADLKTVSIFTDQIQILRVHYLRDNGHSRHTPRLSQKL